MNCNQFLYNQTECIFCLEKISQEHFDKNFDKINKNYKYFEEMNVFLNRVIELKCGHIYHLGCFSKYIKSKDSIQKINCPLCIKRITNIELIEIYKKIYDISRIKTKTENKLTKLKIQLNFKKFSIYSKKILNLSIAMDNIYEYYKIKDNYYQLKDLYKDINFILDDVNRNIFYLS